MKCICGYEHIEVFHQSDRKFIPEIGEEPFVHVEGTFHIRTGIFNEHLKTIRLFACPKCKTIQATI